MQRLYISGLLFLLMVAAFQSCSRRIDIKLPPNEPRLVVYCYLEDGKPLRALITESTALLDTNLIPPMIAATVVVTHNGQTDTLSQGLFADSAARQIYNYGSNRVVQADYGAGETWRIDVYDRQGRHAWATTRFLRPIPFTSIEPRFNKDSSKAYCLIKFSDEEPGVDNYFRLILNRNQPTDTVAVDFLVNNNFVNDNGDYILGGPYRFYKGDTIYARLFHITREYYTYLRTEDDAGDALLDPFAASGEIVSNIHGGIGVFTTLSYSRDTVYVPY